MVREIVKDTEKLSEKCKTVTPKQKAELTELILDMRDTAAYYEDKMGCVGLAAVGFIKTGQAWREIYGVDERGYK